MRPLAILLCTAGCVFVAACGSVGEPLYPAINIPSHVTDLVAVERGDKIEIYFTIPPLTTEGLALTAIGTVELRVGPNTTGGFRVDQWAGNSRRIEIGTPARPGPVHAAVPVQEFIGREAVVAVRIGNTKGRMSEWSNLAVVSVEPPLMTPGNLQAQPAKEGVHITWSAPSESAFRVFRKTGSEVAPQLLATSERPEYLDSSAEYGKSYEYYVQGIHDKTESDVAGPVSITPEDKFPPGVPSGLTVLAGVGSIELAWERNTEPDFKEYRVYRSEENGPFLQIAQEVEAPSYSDRQIESGKRYRYRIAALDQSGNISEPCSPVEIIVP